MANSAKLEIRISTIEPERDPWTGRPFFRASQETCGNVSRGGAFVRTGEAYTPGRRLLVELRLPDGTPHHQMGGCPRLPSQFELGRETPIHPVHRGVGPGLEYGPRRDDIEQHPLDERAFANGFQEPLAGPKRRRRC